MSETEERIRSLERVVSDIISERGQQSQDAVQESDSLEVLAPYGPKLITPVTVATFASSTPAAVPATTFNAAPYVPPGTRVLILDVRATANDPDVATDPPVLSDDASFYVREDSDGDWYVLTSIAAKGTGDITGVGCQGLAPCTRQRKFDWKLDVGLSGEYVIRLIGYYGY